MLVLDFDLERILITLLFWYSRRIIHIYFIFTIFSHMTAISKLLLILMKNVAFCINLNKWTIPLIKDLIKKFQNILTAHQLNFLWSSIVLLEFYSAFSWIHRSPTYQMPFQFVILKLFSFLIYLLKPLIFKDLQNGLRFYLKKIKYFSCIFNKPWYNEVIQCKAIMQVLEISQRRSDVMKQCKMNNVASSRIISLVISLCGFVPSDVSA